MELSTPPFAGVALRLRALGSIARIVARRSLPQSFGAVRLPAGPLDIDAARRRLGGPAPSQARMGQCVRWVDARRIEHVGVLLCVEGERADVWLGGGRVMRTSQAALHALETSDPALLGVARSAREFAAMAPGSTVAWRGPTGERHEGTLREKCKLGALVQTPLGGMLAVSFLLLGAGAPQEPSDPSP